MDGVGGHKCPPAGRSQKGWRGTREKKKKPQKKKRRKSPKRKKSPQQKKRKRCLRLLLLTGGCAALLSPPLASPLPPSYGGFAAHFLRPSLALSAPPSPLVGGCAAPLLRSLASPASPAPLAAVGGCAVLSLLCLSRGSASRRRPLLPAYLLEAKNTQKCRHMS